MVETIRSVENNSGNLVIKTGNVTSRERTCFNCLLIDRQIVNTFVGICETENDNLGKGRLCLKS